MTWNWQLPDWPVFAWDSTRLARALQEFALGGGVILGAQKHLADDEGAQLIVDALTSEALTTSEIEGEILDRASVQSSIRRQLGLTSDQRHVPPAERGISEMIVDLYSTFDQPLTEDGLFGWHRMLTSGRTDLSDIGQYRSGGEPMQVVSGYVGTTRVHFEAPPASRVSIEMNRFIDWFNRTDDKGNEPLPALARAGAAHLYFECIHPFEDGNGRIGRAISQKVLAQGLGQPVIVALAATIQTRRSEYYAALETASKQIEITDWLAWFASVTLEAQRQTLALAEFLIEKAKLLDRLQGSLNSRQLKALLRMLQEGPNGFTGGLSAGNYSRITGASPATSTRDLSDMVELGVLLKVGEQRYARYHLTIPVKPYIRIDIDRDGNIVETHH